MEKIVNVENNDDLVDNKNNDDDDNIDNQDIDDGPIQSDNNNDDDDDDNDDGDESKDKNSTKSNDAMTRPNSRASIQSKADTVGKSTLPPPSTSFINSNWKSTNPYVNYMLDCRKHEFPGQLERKNFFQFAGTGWRLMSTEQKQSYVNGAAMIKKQKLLEMEAAKRGQKRKRLRGEMTMKRANHTSRKANNKKVIKPKRREKKKVKKQKLFKQDSESDTASDDSNESSDNESNASDEII